jgi:hypothetical protein
MKKDLAQLKFNNGSEVLCEVLEWPEDDNQMIVRNALSILNIEYETGERSFVFVPWVNFVDGEKDYILVNSDHIIASNRPSEYLIDQYQIALDETNAIAKKRNIDFQNSKKEMERVLDRVRLELDNIFDDDDDSNIVSFPGFGNKDDGNLH